MIDAPYIVYTPNKDFVLEKDDISGGGGGDSIPIASADRLGGVKVGSGLSITEQGVLSVSGGSGGGVLIIESEMADSVVTLNKTWKEIKDAYISGVSCVVDNSYPDTLNAYLVTTIYNHIDDESIYGVCANTPTGVTSFTTDSENGYPSFTISG